MHIDSYGEFQENLIKNVYTLQENQRINSLHLTARHQEYLYDPILPKLNTLESLKFTGMMRWEEREKAIDTISSLSNLKVLLYRPSYTYHVTRLSSFNILAEKLIDIEEFYTEITSEWIQMIIPLVQRLPKLRIIYLDDIPNNNVRSLFFRHYLEMTLQDLNKERKKLKDACKLTIYLREDHLKSSLMTTECGLMEIKRSSTFSSKHPFFVFPCIFQD